MTMQHRQSRGVCALALAASVLTLACNEEPTGKSASDFEAAAAAAKQRIAKPTDVKPKPVVVPRATGPETVVDPVSGVEQLASDYRYDPYGKRDPFRSFIWDRPDRMEQAAEAGPLEQFDLSQLEVVAVVWRTGNARALVQDPSGESYIIGQGASVGKNQGRVLSIDDNSVVVKEIYVDYLGQETTKDIEMRMRRNEGG
jgi:type IV pilus assembly protein PilP